MALFLILGITAGIAFPAYKWENNPLLGADDVGPKSPLFAGGWENNPVFVKGPLVNCENMPG